MAEKKLAILVLDECKVNVGRYNVSKNKAEKVCHHNICKKLLAMSEESGYPIGVLVYMGIGCDAHKPSVFANGYKVFDEERVKRVINLCNIFATYFGGDKCMAHNDKLVHAVCRYDSIFENKGKVGFFRECIKQHNKPTKNEAFKLSKFKNAAEVAKFIFGDKMLYNERGYIIGAAE